MGPAAYYQTFSKNLFASRSFRILFLASAFAFTMTVARIWYTDSLHYIFLVWNLFLAAIPWLVSRYLRVKRESGITVKGLKAWSLRAIWLLFLPNAPYIITDLYHLRYSSGEFLWFDVLLILSYAWAGLLFGLLSLRDMEMDLRPVLGVPKTKIIIPFILFLSAFGIYIGRFQRWNSWDLFTQPQLLFADVLDLFIHPMMHPRAWGITILMGLFLNLLYLSLRTLRPDVAASTLAQTAINID